MRKPTRLTAGLMLILASCALPAKGNDDASAVPVRRVVLYSSGVGYFEHSGQVEGDAQARLRFKTSQINDMLKSLVLQDLDGGHVGTVVYPSQDPLARTLASFQVDIRSNPSLGELLNQLRGSDVVVTVPGDGEIRGTIIGLERKQKRIDDDTTIQVWVLNLVADGTIRAIELDEARQIELVDPQLRDELTKALTAFAQARDQDKKPVTISFQGKGKRRVRIGYVVETPIWKTTYRLILAEPGQQNAKLQGWAIVENQTETDWNDVQLSLVSGRPISFIQDLYQPLYVPRPVVKPELYASLSPQMYGDGMEEETRVAGKFGAVGGVAGGGRGRGRSLRRLEAKAAPVSIVADMERPMSFMHSGNPEDFDVYTDSLDAAASVASLATAAEMGELFQYTVPGVSLPRQRSAMIPIVTDDIEAERVSIYNRQVLANHPLNGAILKNTTGKHLPQGPVTVIDGEGYAGDARIEDLPADQKRMISYAVDLDVHVQADNGRETNVIETGKIVKGVLSLQRKLVRKQKYTLDNKSDDDKTLVLEHTFRPGWKLVDTPKPFEKTDRLYRFKDTLESGEKKELTVTEERVTIDRIMILPADIGQVLSYARTGEIPERVRNALSKAAQLKGALVETQREIDQKQKDIRSITAEQDRIRKNMGSVGRKGDYYNRLLKKLDNQETKIEKLQMAIDSLRKRLNGERTKLEDYLQNLNVE